MKAIYMWNNGIKQVFKSVELVLFSSKGFPVMEDTCSGLNIIYKLHSGTLKRDVIRVINLSVGPRVVLEL